MFNEKELILKQSFRAGLFLLVFYGAMIGICTVSSILVYHTYWYVSLLLDLNIALIVFLLVNMIRRIEHFIKTNYTLTDKNILTNQDS